MLSNAREGQGCKGAALRTVLGGRRGNHLTLQRMLPRPENGQELRNLSIRTAFETLISHSPDMNFAVLNSLAHRSLSLSQARTKDLLNYLASGPIADAHAEVAVHGVGLHVAEVLVAQEGEVLLGGGAPAERRVGALEPVAELLEHLPLGVARRVRVHPEEVGVRELKLDKHELAVLPRLREVLPDPVPVQRVRAGPGARPDLLMALFNLSYLMLRPAQFGKN